MSFFSIAFHAAAATGIANTGVDCISVAAAGQLWQVWLVIGGANFSDWALHYVWAIAIGSFTFFSASIAVPFFFPWRFFSFHCSFGEGGRDQKKPALASSGRPLCTHGLQRRIVGLWAADRKSVV